MSAAWKCDRCGDFFEETPTRIGKLKREVNAYAQPKHYIAREYGLCPVCAKLFNDFMDMRAVAERIKSREVVE